MEKQFLISQAEFDMIGQCRVELLEVVKEDSPQYRVFLCATESIRSKLWKVANKRRDFVVNVEE